MNYEFKPLYKPNQLIVGTGRTAIVTGWTVKEFIAKQLDKSDYAVIGSLYSSTRGIDFLIRNLLANPHVTKVVIMACTKEDSNSGSTKCLLDFFTHGFYEGVNDVGKKCWVINSSVKGFIDKEILKLALDVFRYKMHAVFAPTRESAIAFAKEYPSPYLPDYSPQIFPKIETQSPVLPGNLYGHRIEGTTIAETWVKIIHRIRTTGVLRPTGYDGQWQELINLMAIVTDEPEEFYFPEPNYLPVTPEFLVNYIPQILHDSPYKEGVKYAYGQRMRSWFGKDQIKQVIDKLSKELIATSAVINLWDVNVDAEKIEGTPCLNHIWFRVIDNKLSMTATFRSNDMFAAWCSNAFGLKALQCYVTEQINTRSQRQLQVGVLTTISQSAHIYDDCFENADSVIQQHYKIVPSFNDPSGNFLIEIEGEQIVVTQLTLNSAEVKRFAGKHPLKLVREICASSPSIQSDHIGYLGIELERASQFLKSGNQYTQDK